MKGIDGFKFTRISATFAFFQRAIVKNRRFLYATMAGAKCFQQLQNNMLRGKFHSKNRRFLFAGIHFYFEQSFGQIVVTMKLQSSL